MGALAPGSVLGGCRIETVVGHGGMGVVYRARQLDLDRDVAVKVIAPHLVDDPRDAGPLPARGARRERRRASQRPATCTATSSRATSCSTRTSARFATPPSNRELAAELCLSVETVKFHLHALFATFGLEDVPQRQKRAQLAQCALEEGVIRVPDLREGGREPPDSRL